MNEKIRNDFPILERKINGKRLVYLDNAATSQKPLQVINAISEFYRQHNANVHRGIHTLSQEATNLYEGAHEKTAKFIGCKKEEIIFVRNTTEAINLLKYSLALKPGDEILLTIMEHHSNIVPWQLLQRNGIKIKFVDINDDGTLKMEQISKMVNKKTKLVSVAHVSNVLGTINDVNEIGKIAHDNDALFLVDGAQSVPHMPVSVKKINCDFLAFSGHKMLGPTGIGVLYGRKALLEEMPPFFTGGDMIKEVHLYESTWNELPWKFEAGTPDIAGGVGLAAAIDYLNKIGMNNVREHEKKITSYALDMLSAMKFVKIYGPGAEKRGGVISFNIGDVHPHDLASLLDEEGIAIRSGQHCAQPLMERLGMVSAARASFYIYNTTQDIDALCAALKKSANIFGLIK